MLRQYSIIGTMSSQRIAPSELVLNPNGSVYHIGLKPEHVMDTVIVVGDPARVRLITDMMDHVRFENHNREFFTRVASYKGRDFTVMSTGIGTDNIDIAINELDAAVNIDLEKRIQKDDTRRLDIIRMGTSGALQEDIPVDTVVASEFGLGFDGVMHYYDSETTKEERSIRDAFIYDSAYPMELAKPYIIKGDLDLRLRVAPDKTRGITATATGFYGPQGRSLRLSLKHPQLNDVMSAFEYQGHRITNYEMETSALFGIGRSLGHRCATICAIIANRLRKEYSKDYKKTVRSMVGEALERLTSD